MTLWKQVHVGPRMSVIYVKTPIPHTLTRPFTLLTARDKFTFMLKGCYRPTWCTSLRLHQFACYDLPTKILGRRWRYNTASLTDRANRQSRLVNSGRWKWDRHWTSHSACGFGPYHSKPFLSMFLPKFFQIAGLDTCQLLHELVPGITQATPGAD